MSERAEVWTMGVGLPRLTARLAERAEAAGWDGMLVVDSQNLAGDPYVGLATAAGATERLLLGTGVTNPWTRHPAATACAIASVQGESGGRAVLGIGRGDSSLAYLGLAPASVEAFSSYLTLLQTYLRGDAVAFDDARAWGGGAPPPVDRLGLGAGPGSSRLEWLGFLGDAPKVPVDVAATGPRVIETAARLADRVTFAVGAEPERVAWAIETARRAALVGRVPDAPLSLGAYVNVVVHPDPAVARELASGSLASFARFSVMHGHSTGPVADDERAVLESIHHAYDMTAHTRAGTPQAAAVTADFADHFAVLGPADHCLRRLRELLDLGLDHLMIIGGSIGADRKEVGLASTRFVEEVLPGLR